MWSLARKHLRTLPHSSKAANGCGPHAIAFGDNTQPGGMNSMVTPRWPPRAKAPSGTTHRGPRYTDRGGQPPAPYSLSRRLIKQIRNTSSEGYTLLLRRSTPGDIPYSYAGDEKWGPCTTLPAYYRTSWGPCTTLASFELDMKSALGLLTAALLACVGVFGGIATLHPD